MGDDREALFNMLHDAISQPAWDECTIDMERAAYLTEWLSDAGWRPPPEPQAGEVAERAREINKRIHIDCQAPRCSCSDGVCAVSETYIRDALLAEHARAEAAERDLKLAQVGLFHDSDGAQYSLLETKKILREREAAEGAVKRLTESAEQARQEIMNAINANTSCLPVDRAFNILDAALTPAGGGDGR